MRICQFQVAGHPQRRVTGDDARHPLPNRHVFPAPKCMLCKYNAKRIHRQHELYCIHINVNSDGIPHPLPEILNSRFERQVHRRTHLCPHKKTNLSHLSLAPARTLPSQRYINNTSPAANGCISIFPPVPGAWQK